MEEQEEELPKRYSLLNILWPKQPPQPQQPLPLPLPLPLPQPTGPLEEPMVKLETVPVDGELILVGTRGTLLAYDTHLTPLWEAPIHGARGLVHFVSIHEYIFALSNQHLTCIHKPTSATIWTRLLEDLVATDSHLNKWKEKYLICSGSGVVFNYSVVGDLIWKTRLKGAGFTPITTAMDEEIIFAGTDGRVYALSPPDGCVLWKNKLPGKGFRGTSFSIHNNTLLVGIGGFIVRLNTTSGEKTGKSIKAKGSATHPISQLLWGEYLITGSGSTIKCVDITTCEVLWKNRVRGLSTHFGFSMALLAGAGAAGVVVGCSGRVLLLHSASGETEWTTPLPGASGAFVSVATHQGRIFAFAYGCLYALDELGTVLAKAKPEDIRVGTGVLGVDNALDAGACSLIFARWVARMN